VEKKLIVSTKKFKGNTIVVSTRLPNDLVKKLDDISKHTGRTRNELIQTCLEFAIENIEIEGEKQ
jgi:predicted DNA-binding protein